MILYYILAETGDGSSRVVGIYTGKAEFEEALENLPCSFFDNDYTTGELQANMPVLT